MKNVLFSKFVVSSYCCRQSSRAIPRLQFSFRSLTTVECKNEQQEESQMSQNANEGWKNNSNNIFTDVQSPANSRLIRVAIIGVPNAGKSTLINQLTNYSVCPVSKRVHTTRSNQRVMLLEDKTQVVFVDTPGVVNAKEIKKFSFSREFISEPDESVKSADLIAIIHDLSHVVLRKKLDSRVLELLKRHENKNSILIMNKIDTVRPKGKLLNAVRYLTSGFVGGRPINLKERRETSINKQSLFEKTKKLMEESNGRAVKVDTKNISKFREFIFTPKEVELGLDKVGWPHFHDVFMISALDGNGVELLKNYLVANAKPLPWLFNEEILTDVPPTELAVKLVNARLLEYLPQEMPYKLSSYMEYWEKQDSGDLRIVVGVKSPHVRITKRIIGHAGSTILTISDEIEKILTNLLHTPVSFHINVITEENKAAST